MKSLEIVNREFNCFTDRLTPLEKKFPLQLDINYNELQLIKQDLEILEILRKNLYIEYDTRLYVKHSFDDEHKDFNKVKQLLEENNEEESL